LSEFLKRLQEGLKAKKQGLGSPIAQNHASLQERSKRLLSGLKNWRLPSPAQLGPLGLQGSLPTFLSKGIRPAGLASNLSYFLMIATAVTLTYWGMRITQIPRAPEAPTSGITKGMTLYSNQEGASAYGLFGTKPLVTENIFLRGVVITSKSIDGALDGFAIFEIDGIPTNAISVGENLGKGLTLKSIGDESATLLYEGQKLDFKLSKAGNKPAPSNKK